MAGMTVCVEQRFRGPPRSANGGYVSGRIAAAIDGPAEVTLLRPPPLDTGLELRRSGDEVELYEGDILVGNARPVDAPLTGLKPLTPGQARAAGQRTFPADRHPLPTCFVCGPHRPHGDGLRIHVGPVDPDDSEWLGVLATTWIPDRSLADASGTVLSEFAWAALDCPTGYACSSSRGMRSILLGRQTVAIRQLPRAGEEYVVAARQTGQDGRKYSAEAALFDRAGDCLAAGTALWIEVSADVQRGLVS